MNDYSRTPALPDVAPLSTALVRHLQAQGALTPALLAQLPALRYQVYQDLQPFVSCGQLSERAFLAVLQAGGSVNAPTTRQHIAGWRTRRLLRMATPDTLEPQTAAALLLALRLIAPAQLDSLPTTLPLCESIWSCWRQDSPADDPAPCSMPLPADLPPTALVWTPWSGATWLTGWYACGRGAVYIPSGLNNTIIRSAFQVWQIPDLACAWLDRHSLAETARGRVLVREQWVQRVTRLARSRLMAR